METREIIINAENPADLGFWAKKWGVSRFEVYEAILATGSLRAGTLKEYVRRDKWIYHPFSEAGKLIKAGINLIF